MLVNLYRIVYTYYLTLISPLVRRNNQGKETELFQVQGIHFTPTQFSELEPLLQAIPTDDRLVACDSRLRQVSDSKTTKSFEDNPANLETLKNNKDAAIEKLNAKNLMYNKFLNGNEPQRNCTVIL